MNKSKNQKDKQYFLHLLLKWDELIKNSKAEEVRNQCQYLNIKKIPSDLRLEFAQIARRVGLPHLIIRWLHPIVRHEAYNSHLTPTTKEISLYALGLIRVGAFHEAKGLLEKCNPKDDPQVNFYFASLYMNQWNYKKAIPYLKKYLKSNITEYQVAVAKVNLCASLVSIGNFVQSEKEIAKTLKLVKLKNYPLLMGNILEIQAQHYFEKREIENSHKALVEASQYLKDSNSQYNIYLEKWKASLQFLLNPNLKSNIEDFESVKSKALALKEWEIVRSCDLIKAHITSNEELLKYIYWGTLFKKYKENILKLSKTSFGSQNEYILRSEIYNMDPPINLLKMCQYKKIRKVLFILTQDFYRPIRTTEIFSFLFPNEYYNPLTSNNRVYQLIQRARAWLLKFSLPLQINVYHHSYKLEITKPCSILLSKYFDDSKFKINEMNLDMPILKNEHFTSKEFADYFKITQRSAQRKIKELLFSKRIKKVNFGKISKYSIQSVE